MKVDRAAIIALYKRGVKQAEIVRQLKIPKQTVSKAVKRYQQVGHLEDRSRSGRPRTACTSKNRKLIRERIRRKSRVSLRKIAREIGISHQSASRIAKEELGLRPYKMLKAQLLTENQKKIRLERCHILLQRHAAQEVVFSD